MDVAASSTGPPRPHLILWQDFFLFRNHLCLAFELLSLNLYELIRHNKFCGLSLSLVRVFVNQASTACIGFRGCGRALLDTRLSRAEHAHRMCHCAPQHETLAY